MLRGSDSEAALTFDLTSSDGRGRVLMLRRNLFLAPVLGVNLLREALTGEAGLLLMATLSRRCFTFLSLVSSDSLFLDLNRNLLFVFWGTNFDPVLPNDLGLLTTRLCSLL